MTWQEAYIWGRDALQKSYVPDSDIDSRYLLEYLLHVDHSKFLLLGNEVLKEEDWSTFRDLIKQRKKRIPLQYIIGETEFMGLPFLVNEAVLIPRQETECLVELLLPLAKNKRILDLCTGSGCIGISIAVFEMRAEVFCSDISKEAICVAKKNAQLNKVKIDFLCSDLFEKVKGKYDIIVSNPPYIKSRVISGLMPEVREHEPKLALDGKEDGLYFYRKIIDSAASFLNSDGILAFEVGFDQAIEISRYMKENGFVNIKVKKDHAKLDRIVIGIWSGNCIK